MLYKYLSFISIGLFLVGCKASTDQLIREGIRLKDKGDYLGAIAKFSAVIDRNSKLQIAYFDEAICYSNLKDYGKALGNLNKILAMHGSGSMELIMNPDGPFATEEDKAYVPRMTIIFQRAQINYSMDSFRNSFDDFKTCLENDYQKNDCYLWLGTIYIKCGNKAKGCELYKKANVFGNNEDAIRLIKNNCN